MNIIKYLYYMYYRPKLFFPKNNYSTLGEDLIIKKFFKKKSKGIYIDIGCYHPIEGSNTYLLFKKGWSGLNIDLNKTSIELFKIARKNDVNLRVAITNQSKKIKYYFRKNINMLNTINRKYAINAFKNGYETDYVQSSTLNSVLEKSKYKNKKIDFLNIDIEGNEINALTLGCVGDCTTINNIEIMSNSDDGIELFGGTVNVENLLVWGCADDFVDVDLGYGGNINNVLLVPDYVANNTLELDGGEGFHNPFFNISNIVIKYHENNQMHFRDGVNGSISYQGYANVIADPGTNIGIDTLVNLDESIFDWTHYGQNY